MVSLRCSVSFDKVLTNGVMFMYTINILKMKTFSPGVAMVIDLEQEKLSNPC